MTTVHSERDIVQLKDKLVALWWTKNVMEILCLGNLKPSLTNTLIQCICNKLTLTY